MMSNFDLAKTVDDFIYGRGAALDNYYIEQTPFSETLCYKNPEGREFDLPINDPELATAVIARLKELGVRIVKLG